MSAFSGQPIHWLPTTRFILIKPLMADKPNQICLNMTSFEEITDSREADMFDGNN